MFITLNGEPFEIDEPLTVTDLLTRLAIDPRRVAVEHNLEILKRTLFADTWCTKATGSRSSISLAAGNEARSLKPGARRPEAESHS